MALLFEVADLRNEVGSFGKLAVDVLAPGSEQVLRGVVSELDGIAKSNSGPVRWRIHEQLPLFSEASIGEYMPDDEGGVVVHAEMTFIWELEPVRPSGDTRPAKQVRLCGLASTSIRLLEGDPSDPGPHSELAMWKMDIADDSSPGAYFHVQVLGRAGDARFPKEVDVPRFPGLLNSPFACMEFALGELFQMRWKKIAEKDSASLRQWRSIQAHRHERHLEWARDQVVQTSGSPWLAWKIAQPEPQLFLRP